MGGFNKKNVQNIFSITCASFTGSAGAFVNIYKIKKWKTTVCVQNYCCMHVGANELDDP